ncbi:MAG TPA: HK97 gp10 family phage protein [Candidatus Limiplasma sp.]|nr:HK97 gp10 family phage protein [Candidatus Limiplasma sp.]HRX07694.1 HK97 gp10 family phage protein [Candidatus Limiplasma sp.]
MTRADGAAAGSQLGTLAAALRRAVGDAVAEEAQALRDEARSRCPQDAGTLRESIRAEVTMAGDTAEAVIGSGLPYAAALELGTLAAPPKPYLAPAYEARRGGIAGRIQAEIQQALEENRA